MFELVSNYTPNGDQPNAIKELTDGVLKGVKHQVLLGATGTGKTFTIANVIKNVNKQTLDFTMTVTGYKINNGAGFITILMGGV